MIKFFVVLSSAFDEGMQQETVIDQQMPDHQLARHTPTRSKSPAHHSHRSLAPPTELETVTEDPMEGSSRAIYGRVTRSLSPAIN